MRKILALVMVLTLVLTGAAFATGITATGTYTDGTYTATSDGYLGEMTVEVTVAEGKITKIDVKSVDTEEVVGPATTTLTEAIIAANTVTDIDTVSGASFSSKGILTGVAKALEQAGATVELPAAPEVVEEKAEDKIEGKVVYQGLGSDVMFRVGPGKDSAEVQVYSFNVVMAAATFDEEGRILGVNVDAYEVATPNYDGASMPHFSGWPGTAGYNVTDHETAKVTGVSDNNEEAIKAEVNGWQTKRERGDAYGMNAQNDWYKQMDFYQKFFVGKTVAEIEEWFTKYCSDRNGRPLNPKTENEVDLAKIATLTDAEKEALTDIVSGATMSVNDGHGNILAAIKNAYENRVAVGVGE